MQHLRNYKKCKNLINIDIRHRGNRKGSKYKSSKRRVRAHTSATQATTSTSTISNNDVMIFFLARVHETWMKESFSAIDRYLL